jgi:molybdenum cofactor biosynthesis enzyme MoaA
MELSKIIGVKDYQVFAGPDWPSYQDIVDQRSVSNSVIQQEVDEFVRMMTQTFQELILPGEELAEHNQQRQQQVFFDKKLTSNDRCNIPWNTMGINANGEIFICSSPSWIPKFVGNILQVSSVYNALNSDIALKIRNEISNNRYFYCNHKICSFFRNIPSKFYNKQSTDDQSLAPLLDLSNDRLQVNAIPTNLIFDFDYTCNFKCPSCRTELINNNKHHVIRKINNDIVDKIKTLIIDQIENQPISIRWCGGEPFISEPYLDLLDYIANTGKTNIQHIIQTNGSYLKSKQYLLQKLLPVTQELRVSFDAATESTYKQIRVNGQWELLLDNVRWIKQFINKNNFSTRLTADFVVQLDNFKEIPLFVELCDQLGIEHINFQKMWNWGTWPQDVFDSKNVFNPEHSDFAELQDIFKQINREIVL